MAEPPVNHERGPEPPRHLRPIRGVERWGGSLILIGVLLLILAIVLIFVAPSALWFLVYPLLILGAVGLLITAAALLLRHL